jgi:hypothetical protein
MAADEPIYYRNYALEMRRMIDEYTSDGPYNTAHIAAEIVRKLTETDKDLLVGWLLFQAKDVLRAAINRRDASLRTHVRRNANRIAFNEAAKKFSEGDNEALGGFFAMVHVTADGLRKRLSQMTAKDLHFVADSYQKRADQNAMQAAFLNVLARRLDNEPTKTVADIYDEQRLAQMWLSISDASVIREAKEAKRTAPKTRSARVRQGDDRHIVAEHAFPEPDEV